MVDTTNKTEHAADVSRSTQDSAEGIKLVVDDGQPGVSNNGHQVRPSPSGTVADSNSDAEFDELPAGTASVANLSARQKRRRAHKNARMMWVAASALIFVIVLAGAMTFWQGQQAAVRHAVPALGTDYTPVPYYTPYQAPFWANWLNWIPKLSGKGTGTIAKLDWSLLGQVLQGLFIFSGVLGVAFWVYAMNARRRYIHIDKIGLLISDSPKLGEGDPRFIPWGCLTDVEVVHGKDKKVLDDEALASGERIDPTVVFHVDDGSSLQVTWQDIVACTESGAFVNSLKTFAPYAIEDTVFPGTEQITKVDNNTYTQLWFKYYSKASERQRTGYLAKGEKLQDGRYEVAGQLGGGGQGMAYLAVDSKPDAGCPSEIVLKEYILPVHRGQQVLQATLEKLHKEAEILRSINHPNIVKFYNEFNEDQRGYLVMEYVAGTPLKQLVVQLGPQPEKFVVELALQACDILECLHGMTPPVVHRDLTPDNLILEEGGLVKLVDFNVAHQLESTATATVVGKHCYIPPEQFRGKPSPQSDIYALGGTLHYLLTGQEPEPLTVSHPHQLRAEVSEDLDNIVAGCTILDSARRIGDAKQLRSVLLELQKKMK
jgi:tRNA A-37 threonylcarbamoyl transferase component Bud32